MLCDDSNGGRFRASALDEMFRSAPPDVIDRVCPRWRTDKSTLRALLHYRRSDVRLTLDKRVHACNYAGCGRLCVTDFQLTIHKRTHAREKPFPCGRTGCDERFVSKDHLTSHQQTHQTEENQQCYACGHEGCRHHFNRREGLTRHMNAHERGTESPYMCRGCGQRFYWMRKLDAHLRSCADNGPYACDVEGCSEHYACRDGLSAHARAHEDHTVMLEAGAILASIHTE
jgi:hypothetical protein